MSGEAALNRLLGLGARAHALAGQGHTHAAIADLRHAVDLARPVGDPAMFVRAAAGLLALDGNDTLAAEAHATANQILVALPDTEMRHRFADAEVLQSLRRIDL